MFPRLLSPVLDRVSSNSEKSLGKDTSLRKTVVSVKKNWPSQSRERNLPEEIESLGKMLVRGTYKQIATAAWKCPMLKKELQLLVAKEIEKETSRLCSKQNPSILRKTDKESLLSFTMAKLSDEIKHRAPLFYEVLTAASTNRRSRAQPSPKSAFGAVRWH